MGLYLNWKKDRTHNSEYAGLSPARPTLRIVVMTQPLLWCLKHPVGLLDYHTLSKRWRRCVSLSLPVLWWGQSKHWKEHGLPGWRNMKKQGFRIVRARVVEIEESIRGRSKEDRQGKS